MKYMQRINHVNRMDSVNRVNGVFRVNGANGLQVVNSANSVNRLKRLAGFTLIEMLVAVFCLAVLGAAGFSMLFQMNTTKDVVIAQAERLEELQRTFYWMAEDFSQVVDRPVRSASDERIPSFLVSLQGDSLIQISRSGWTNPARTVSSARSDLQRVSYSLDEDKLIRNYWYHLDTLDDAPTKRRQLLSKVEDVSMRFLDREGSWHDSWPPLDVVDDPGLPAAVEANLTLEDLGPINRLFALPL